MRILLITSEAWNDAVYGNNVLTNWFAGFDAEFAQIYCSPGLPLNSVCHRYFRITDGEMACSLFFGPKAGHVVSMPEDDVQQQLSKENAQRKGVYGVMKRVSTVIHTPVMLLRDFIWCNGHYNKQAMKEFIDNFNPDIVFCPRMVTPKLMRLEKIVSSLTNAPFVAFTADNEASLSHYNWSPLFWVRVWMMHRMFCKHVKLYNHYFMFSEDQAKEYHQQYDLPTSCLYKCGSFTEKFEPKSVNKPIRMIYAGRLFCNRWKTLAAIGEVLEELNQDKEKMMLDVYTADVLTRKQKKVLGQFKHLHVHSPITPAQLTEEYKKADIALHVESFDKKYRLATRYSFSTKIIDLMASSCAIMAICWDKHAGYQYLKQHDAAFCISSYDDILPMVEKICGEPTLISEYAEKAWKCGKDNHTSEIIQRQIKDTFEKVIAENR